MTKRIISNRLIKRGLIIIGILAGLITILLIITSVYIGSNKSRIIDKIKTEFSKSIKGELIIKDIDVSLVSTFPYTAINLYQISILDTQYHKALAAVQHASCRVNLFQLLSSQPEISKLVIGKGYFHFFTDTSGYSNAYLLLKKDTTTKTTPGIVIHRVELEDIDVLIEDAIKNKRYAFFFDDLYATINKRGDVFNITMDQKGLIKGLGFNLAKGLYLEHQTIEGNNWHILFNTSTKQLSFSNKSVRINEHEYNLQGEFHLKDSAWFKLHAITENVLYKNAMQLLTERIRNKLMKLGIDKELNVDAMLEGPLTNNKDPHVVVHYSTKGNAITTPVAYFTDCRFSGTFNNKESDSLPVSDANSVVTVNKFRGNWGNVPLEADSIRLENVSNPVIRFNFKSNSDFKTLNDQLALRNIEFTGGKAALSLQYNGKLIADPSLLSAVTADLDLQNASLVYLAKDISFSNCFGNISFSENNIAVNNLRCDVKQNHFEINITGTNVNSLSKTVAGKTIITCNVFSPFLNLNDFRTFFTKSVDTGKVKNPHHFATTANKIDDILEQGDLVLNIKADRLQMNRFNAENVTARLLFQQDHWEIQNANLKHAGGDLSVAGKIQEINPGYHRVGAILNMRNMDVRKVFYAFDNFGQDDITHNNLRGTMNANTNITFGLNNSGHIIPNSINGTVDFSIRNGALVHFIPLEKIQDIAFLNRDLSNVRFDELKNTFTIQNNKVQIPRMEIASTVVTMFIEGIYDLNKKNTDISIQVPLSNLKRMDADYKPKNQGVNSDPGMSVYMRAKSDETGKVKLSLELFKKKKKKGKK